MRAERFHGHCAGRRSPTYHTWQSMVARCTRPTHRDFARYGGRGISVCDRWRSFENFLADMGERPAGMTIDRIDNNGNYQPGNCRWATPKEQSANRRPTKTLTVGGETASLTEWARRAGVRPWLIQNRIAKGWTPEDAVQREPLSRSEISAAGNAARWGRA